MRQRSFLFGCVLGLLYAVQSAFASPQAGAESPESLGPHIAVLLPLKSKTLGQAAQAVREGVEAASAMPVETGKPALPVAIYPTGDSEDEVLAGYQTAVGHDARVVIGPLGRTPTAALAGVATLPLPTLALSPLESGPKPAGPWHSLSLSVEDEARQVARLAYGQGARNAWILVSEPGSGPRVQASFADEWKRLGGAVTRERALKGEPAELKQLRASLKKEDKPDMVFLAMNSKSAKQIRPWLDTTIPTWGTSTIYDGQPTQPGNMDLIRVRFVDQPWLVQADAATMLGIGRPEKPLRADMERLYGLGVDAWRLAQWIAAGRTAEGFELDGVTGRLRLEADGHFTRTPLAVEIGEEKPVPLE